MGQGTADCPDRPTEVSVIRFVSRNRTIEEIAPKKEIFTCKQKGCGKIFTNHDEFRTHEALEELKIRFICREPGCGKELSDPGTMWRHYQEFHSNETNLFVCPYTSCGSLHTTSEILEEHIENSHRQPPTLPTEPEIICFEGPAAAAAAAVTAVTADVNTQIDLEEETLIKTAAVDDEDDELEEEFEDEELMKTGVDNDDNDYIKREKKNKNRWIKRNICAGGGATCQNNTYIITPKISQNNGLYLKTNGERLIINNDISDKKITNENKETDNYSSSDFIKKKFVNDTNDDEDYYIKIYDDNNGKTDNDEILFDNNHHEEKIQEHRIDLGNLESVFRSGLEGETKKIESTNNTIDNNANCSEDEEYTPKKQRMSRYKQEQPYKCEINGCGKTYKYISHYRHHQDSHKVQDNNCLNKINKLAIIKGNKGKVAAEGATTATTVSFFLCKIPGCGAQANNVTTLWKHYQDNHATTKANINQSSTINNQLFR